MIELAGKNAQFRKGEKVYYSNCRLKGKTAFLAGPFITAPEAEATLEIVGPIALQQHPETRRATFGVVEVNAPGNGPGEYNEHLPDDIFVTLAIGVKLN